jgi:hypothetical protein
LVINASYRLGLSIRGEGLQHSVVRPDSSTDQTQTPTHKYPYLQPSIEYYKTLQLISLLAFYKHGIAEANIPRPSKTPRRRGCTRPRAGLGIPSLWSDKRRCRRSHPLATRPSVPLLVLVGCSSPRPRQKLPVQTSSRSSFSTGLLVLHCVTRLRSAHLVHVRHPFPSISAHHLDRIDVLRCNETDAGP